MYIKAKFSETAPQATSVALCVTSRAGVKSRSQTSPHSGTLVCRNTARYSPSLPF